MIPTPGPKLNIIRQTCVAKKNDALKFPVIVFWS